MCVHGVIQNSKLNGTYLPPPVNQSTPALVSCILLQSSSDLDMDRGDIIDGTVKEVSQSVNQMLLKTSTNNPINSLTQKNYMHDNVTTYRQCMTQKPR